MKRIAIIGSGISGLYAAYLLHKDYEITIYENMNAMDPIFSFIERSLSKNLVKNVDKVNLLYLRDDVARKKNG